MSKRAQLANLEAMTCCFVYTGAADEVFSGYFTIHLEVSSCGHGYGAVSVICALKPYEQAFCWFSLRRASCIVAEHLGAGHELQEKQETIGPTIILLLLANLILHFRSCLSALLFRKL